MLGGEDMSVSRDVAALRSRILRTNREGRYEYKLVSSFAGTTAEAQGERVVSRFLRRFQPVKEERRRRTNVALGFDAHADSLLDYPSIIQHKIGGEWPQYNMLISVHVPACAYRCWHCYNDKMLHSPDNADWISAEQLVDEFVKQREHDSHRQAEYPSNVLRITGGEPFLVPELILECLWELKRRGLHEHVFVWTETGLYPFIPEGSPSFVEGLTIRTGGQERKVLEELARQEHTNLAVHPCLHGADSDSIRQITGRDDIGIEQLLLALGSLLKSGIDIYPTLGSNVSPSASIPGLFSRLYDMDRNLALRFALVEYDMDYREIQTRLSEEQPSRPCRLYSKFTNLRIWDDLLMRHYGVGYGVLPRHLIQIGEGAAKVVRARESFRPKESDQPGNELLYVFKSSYREDYHRELLDILALPTGHIYELEYDKQWVQDDLWHHMTIRPDDYLDKPALLLYVDLDSPDMQIIPLRRLKIRHVEVQGRVLLLTLELTGFAPPPSDSPDSLKGLRRKLERLFGTHTMSGTSLDKLVQLAEEAHELRELQEASSLSAWREVVDQLHRNRCIKFDKSLFYRIEIEAAKAAQPNAQRPRTVYEVSGGQRFSIRVDYYLPNYDEFPTADVEARTVSYESSSEIVEAVMSTQLVLSKYGSDTLVFATKVLPDTRICAIHFRSPRTPFAAPLLDIPICVRGAGKRIGAARAGGAASFGLGSAMTGAFFSLLSLNIVEWWIVGPGLGLIALGAWLSYLGTRHTAC